MLVQLCLIILIESSHALVRNSNYRLEQVLILSRHNIRTPLASNLDAVTPKTWPEWKQKAGDLTAKGYLLEGYMGKFFAQWFEEQKLLPSGCPSEEVLYVYANTKQRTRASAQAFVKKAFPNCSVIVHTKNTKKSDPLFVPVIHNNTAIFKEIALKEMQERLSTLSLNKSLTDLEQILEFKQSKMCKEAKVCKLTGPCKPVIDEDRPRVTGGIKLGHSVVDTFVMQYYEGLPLKDVAWGLINDISEWHSLLDVQDGYHNVIFNTTHIAKDIAKPLVHYIANTFKNKTPKILLLMGHDANMLTVMNALRFKVYRLPSQFELTPVGSKVVFQKWFDNVNKIYMLRVEYVYQSKKQLRNGEELSLENPPQSHVLELKDCKINDDEFCLWDDFIKLLDDVILSYN